MATRMTYLLVILIWTTTPLAIKLGGDSLDPMASLTLRMLIAFLKGSEICAVGGIAALNIKQNGMVYLAGSLGLFPNMALVYFAAEYISSGLIALMFGLTPFFTALLARPILGKNLLLPHKIIAIILAMIGLFFIFFDDTVITGKAYIGLLLMLGSNIIFSACILWVKRLNKILHVPPFEQTLGSMAFSLPGLLITWFCIFGFEPLKFSLISIGSLLYLSLVASLIGFAAYYHVLNKMKVETAALIPLITPISAMILGVIVADEIITNYMYTGAFFMIFALAIHQEFFNILFDVMVKLKNKMG